MNERVLQSICTRIMACYAYYRLDFRYDGLLDRMILLEAGADFENMTGIDMNGLVGKSVFEHGREISEDKFDWERLHHEIFARSKTKEESAWYEQFAGRYIKISMDYPDEEHVVVILQDVTSEITKNQEINIENLDVIFNSTHDAMFLAEFKEGEFRYIRNNKVHEKVTGMTGINGKTPEEILGIETGNRVRQSYQKCLETGEAVSFEFTQDFGTGERDWLTKLTPLSVNGKQQYLIGSRTDITDLKRLKKEKEELLHRLESMFGEHDAIMLLINPETGYILDANPSACTFYGYDKQELLSMRIQEINQLPEDEVKKRRMMAYEANQKYFLFPHKLRDGKIRMVDVYSCPITYGKETQLLSIIFDVTDRERYRQELQREKERLRITLYSIGDGVITTDNAGLVTSMNQVAVEITGWQEHEGIGKKYEEIIRLRNEETGNGVRNPIGVALESGHIAGITNHTVLIRKDGRTVPIADSAAPIKDESGRIFGAVMVFWDVSHDKEQQRQILYLSYHDPLTGLHNRRYVEDQMKKMNDPEKLPVSVIMGDVNGLKITNDVFGHYAGDHLLQKVADIFRRICKQEDIVARWGGDEFLILLPHTSRESAEKVIEQARGLFRKSKEESLQVSVSLGCAVKEHAEDSIEDAVREAEELMYHQKLLEGTSYRNTIINTLLATLHEKSMETEAHAERLKGFCLNIGKKLHLKADIMNELELLAVLHDIGKVGVPQHILQKAGRLSNPEWDEMKRHSEIGYRIAQTTPELSVVADYILSHHERWDGLGYPRNLKGEQIPILCRILAVADSYDAMTHDRVYRNAMEKQAAIEELTRNSGTQFDPKVVSIFLNILPEIENNKILEK